MSVEITTYAELQAINSALSGDYLLMNDIDATSEADFVPLGSIASPFTGSFDGDGWKLLNFSITVGAVSGFPTGLFGVISATNDKFVRDLDIVDIDVFSEATTGSNAPAGALVGRIVGSGTFEVHHVTASGAVEKTFSFSERLSGMIGDMDASNTSVHHCRADVDCTDAGGQAGGFIGLLMDGSIYDSKASGNVVGTNNNNGGFVGVAEGGTINRCESTGDVTGNVILGGFIGVISGADLSNCKAFGNVTATNAGISNSGGFLGSSGSGTIDNCYCVNDPTGHPTNLRADIGLNSGATVTNCFYDSDVTSLATREFTGKTTAEMQTLSTFTTAGWNMVLEADYDPDNPSDWYLPDGDYPRLGWEYRGIIIDWIELSESFNAVAQTTLEIEINWLETSEAFNAPPITAPPFSVKREPGQVTILTDPQHRVAILRYESDTATGALERIGNTVTGEYIDDTIEDEQNYTYSCAYLLDDTENQFAIPIFTIGENRVL